MKPKHILQRFADSTTMHGVPKVILARSPLTRGFWSVICIAAGGIFCVQMTEVLQRFFSYPKKVTVEVVSSPVPFPSVSLCNMRNLDFYILNTLNRLFLQDHHPLSHINASDNPFIREYMKLVAKYDPLWYEYQDTHPVVFQEVFSRTTLSANIPPEIISLAAVQLHEFIVNCYFGGNTCNRSEDFQTFFDPYYFNCFTYNAPRSSDLPEEDLLSLSEGIENGWSAVVLTGSGMLDRNKEIRVLPGLHETRSAVAASEGVRVVIHPPDTQPFPFAEGFDVPPGYSASFGIRPRMNIRIGLPHGNCSQNNPFGAEEDADVLGTHSSGTSSNGQKRRYRGISCQKMCVQSHVIRNCNCYDASLPMLKKTGAGEKPCRRNDEFPDSCMLNASEECLVTLLSMYQRIQCARETRDHVTRNLTLMSQCLCHPPCDEFLYDISYSLSKWPASGYEGDAAYMDVFYVESFRERFADTVKNQTVMDYFKDENRESTMKDFSRLNVYVADSNVIKTQETPDYEPNQLVSDIGGQLGIWVGISVITLSEVMELLCFLVQYLLSAKREQPAANCSEDKYGHSVPTSGTTSCLISEDGEGSVVRNGCSFATSKQQVPTIFCEYDVSNLSSQTTPVTQSKSEAYRFEENYTQFEYSPYVDKSPEQGYTFEPIQRDRSEMFRTVFTEPFFK